MVQMKQLVRENDTQRKTGSVKLCEPVQPEEKRSRIVVRNLPIEAKAGKHQINFSPRSIKIRKSGAKRFLDGFTFFDEARVNFSYGGQVRRDLIKIFFEGRRVCFENIWSTVDFRVGLYHLVGKQSDTLLLFCWKCVEAMEEAGNKIKGLDETSFRGNRVANRYHRGKQQERLPTAQRFSSLFHTCRLMSNEMKGYRVTRQPPGKKACLFRGRHT